MPIEMPSQESEVKGVRFRILSEEDIIKESALKITKSGTVGIDTIGDPRLGSVHNLPCGTCKKKEECQGHYGHFTLPIKILNPLPELRKLALKILRMVCPNCSELLIDSGRLAMMFDNSGTSSRNEIFESLQKEFIKVKNCPDPDCFQGVPSYAISDGLIVATYKKRSESIKMVVTDDELFKIFSRMNGECIRSLGLDENFRPVDLIIRTLPIPPLCTRPSVKTPNGVECDDDNTHKLAKIVMLSRKIFDIDNGDNMSEAKNSETKGSKFTESSSERDHYVKSLIFNINTMFDNSEGLSRSPNHRPTMCYKQRLCGKKSRVRGNMMGKRCNYTARSVITPGAHQLTDQVGLPKNITDILTKPITVYLFNIDKLQDNLDEINFVHRGDVVYVMKYVLWTTQTKLFPGDTVRRGSTMFKDIDKYQNISDFKLQVGDVIIRRDGEVVDDIKVKKRKDFKLQIGDVVDVKLSNGDYVLVNRQPTLGAGGIMALRVKRIQGRTISLPLATTKSYNADFDGDEMNIHAPQTLAAIAEAKVLCSVKRNIIQEQNNAPRICIVQDAIIAMFLMSRECHPMENYTFFDLCMMGHDGISDNAEGLSIDFCLSKVQKFNEVRNEFKIETASEYNTHLLISLLFPNDFQYEKYDTDGKSAIKIVDGIFLYGKLTKRDLGGSSTGIIRVLVKEYGDTVALSFIDNVQFFGNEWLTQYGFSVSISDCIMSDEINEEISLSTELAFAKADRCKSQRNPIVREAETIAALNEARDIGHRLVDSTMIDNGFKVMVESGARGSTSNTAQISALLGQQISLGSRIKLDYGEGLRTHPHYPIENLTPLQEYESRGFISGCFLKGINIREFFFHAILGRAGIIDTACETAKVGYTQRRTVKMLEDLQIRGDGSVRMTGNKTSNIIQFAYGTDGMDPGKLVRIGNKLSSCNIGRLVQKLNRNAGIKYIDECNILKRSTIPREIVEHHARDVMCIIRMMMKYNRKVFSEKQNSQKGKRPMNKYKKIKVSRGELDKLDNYIVLSKDREHSY